MTKTQRRNIIREKRELLFSSTKPFLPQLKISNNKSIPIFSYVSETRWQNGDGNNTLAVENRILDLIEKNITIQRQQEKSFASVPARHLRNTRDIKESTGSLTEMEQCKNFIFVIKYEDPYEISNNFTIKYKGKIYPYDTYRVMNDGLYVCKSSDDLIQQRWRNVTARDKQRIPYKHCNWSVDSFYHENYSIFKDFNIFFKPTNQNFTREDYGVISGYFSICSSKLSLSCNDYLLKVKYSEQYKVFNDFSLIYNNRKYDYREYRINNNMIVMCASNHSTVLHIWRTRNSFEKSGLLRPLGCTLFQVFLYTVNRRFTLYVSPTSQYFTRNDYDVRDGELVLCKEILRPVPCQYCEEDLLMCNDSIINIKYDDEYKVWNNFSILYKNKMYSYTEYRALNDSIKICNSTDNFTNNIWKLRNLWVIATTHSSSCNFNDSTIGNYDYIVNKQLTIYYSGSSQYFTRHDYGVGYGTPYICKKALKPDSYQYTKEDLLMCNNSIINIKYDDEYKVWNNFSILYKNKMYSYTEYRALNDSIKICNSTDNFVKNIWKLRNYWVKSNRYSRSCKTRWKIYKHAYIVYKKFTVYFGAKSQYFTKHDYDVKDGELVVCEKILRLGSFQYSKEDLLMCNDSIINIKYDDEYKVWNNFSILYKNKMYSYTEYRALNDSIKICNSTDNVTKNIWKLRNDWIMRVRHSQSCNFDYLTIYNYYYIVDKLFTVYYSGSSQYFTRPNYDVVAGKPNICKETLKPDSYQYTKEDLLMCNDSIINIKYDDEYKVWNNFSILYKNKMYSYNEYRALDDSIKICNSTDNFTKNIWKLRNEAVVETRIVKSCSEPKIFFPLYEGENDVLKNFTVLIRATKLLIAKNDYGIFNGTPFLCVNECVNSTFTINFEDEYIVWKNFSMMYKGEMYHYFQYGVTDNGLQICNSSDRLIKEKWRNLTALEKRATAYTDCNGHVGGFYHENYTVYKNFSVFLKPTNQTFIRQDYGIISGYFLICSAKLNLSCEKSLLEVKYGEQYEVFKNFSMFYNNTVYDYREYRFGLDGVKTCTSKDVRVQAIWKTQNLWSKSLGAPCDSPHKLNTREYAVTKEFDIHSTDDGQMFNRYKYAVIDAFPYVCNQISRPNYIITDVNIIIAPLCALALSFICLVLLLVIYCLLPDLRTLPGLNLMSLCFAFLIWQIYLVIFLSSYSHLGKLSSIPCERLFVITQFITYSIVMNAVVNIYHLRKTFCGNTLVKAEDVNKCKKFLKYSVFSWGVPVGVAIVYIVLLKTQTLQFNQHDTSVKGAVQPSLRFYQHIELADRKGNPHTTSKKKNFMSHFSLKDELCKDDKDDVSKKDDPVRPLLSTYGKEKSAKVELYFRSKFKVCQEDKHNVSKKNDRPSTRFRELRVVLGNENNNERIYHHITGDCINGRITYSWSTAVDVYGIQGCLMLYIVITFIVTAYKIRQKLKAGQSIAQKSNVVKRRKFILLLKLSTTTALSYWFPLFLSEMIYFDFDVKIALYTVTLLTGAYIGIAFSFTRRNYQLLKKKYFPARDRPVYNRVAANQ